MAEMFVRFMIYSFIGWSYETTIYSVKSKKFVDSGMLYGCYCPIYGVGGLAIELFFGRARNPMLIFLGAMTVCCLLEYLSSWIIEKLCGARWWDYSDWPLNINGRISLFSGMAFGIMSVMLVLYINPALVELIGKFPRDWTVMVADVLLVVFMLDIFATYRRCRRMEKKEDQVTVIRSLPFDFMPKIEMPRFSGRVQSIASSVRSGGNSFKEFVREKVEEILSRL